MRVLHLTTEFPPVIYGGLGTAVGGWVTASARAGMTMGVLLVEGELVIDDPAGSARYGAGGLGQSHPLAREIEGGERAVVDRDGIRFFQASWGDAADAGVRLARRWRPDIVHLHTAMVWPVAQAIQHQTSLPLVYHVHSVDKAEYEIGQEPQPWLAHSGAGAEEARLSWTWPKRVAAMREVYAELTQHERSAPRFALCGWDHAPRASASPPDSSPARGTGTGFRWPSPAVAMT